MQARILIAALVVALVVSPATAATKIDDPVKFVRGVYENILRNHNYTEPEDIYTHRLAGLFALEKREAKGEVGRMDFDFWVNGQDSSLTDFVATSKVVEGTKDREVVSVRFRNSSRVDDEIHFYFEKTIAGWKLDDARCMTKAGWTLSLILKYGWDAVK